MHTATTPQWTPARQHDFAALTWWAHGDAPVRVADLLVPLVDGRAAMLAMCVAFLTARESIWLADWSIYARLRMVRGQDLRAGPDGSPAQEALLARLRAAGLDEDAVALWQSGLVSVRDVLACAAQRGVAVHVLLWGPYNPFGLVHIINNPAQQRRLLEQRGVQCRLDKSSRSPFHVAQALHQKCAVVDSRLAFVGGVDLNVERNGDYDRWDVPAHPFASSLRSTTLGPAPHPWHDAHLMVVGSAARDVERNIRQRWDEANLGFWHVLTPPLRHLVRRTRSGEILGRRLAVACETRANAPDGASAQVPGANAQVQVVRTIPALTYRFAPEGVRGIAQVYLNAVRQAQRFIYLESQYLWLEGYEGINIWRLGWPSHSMRRLLDALAAAAERGVHIALVLPDHPNAGRHYSSDTIGWLRARLGVPAASRLHCFMLGASTPPSDGGPARYRPVYVHAKVAVIDDRWATVGSANLNSRGVSHDAEINIAVLDEQFATSLRRALWAEHLGMLATATTGWPAPAALPVTEPMRPPAEYAGLLALLHAAQHDGTASALPAALADPLAGIALLERCARANLEHVRLGQPMVGQLLPYLRRADTSWVGLPVDREMGLLDPLRAAREGVAIHQDRRYI